MKYALISPKETVSYVSGWTGIRPQQPIVTTIANAERVAETATEFFEVAPPLFWVDCADDIVADEWYYNGVTQQFSVIPPDEPQPQPVSQGAQTL
jgi:hypothetical protein